MSVALYVLVIWLVVSVPFGLLVGWACGLNQLSPDAGEMPVPGAEPNPPSVGAPKLATN